MTRSMTSGHCSDTGGYNERGTIPKLLEERGIGVAAIDWVIAEAQRHIDNDFALALEEIADRVEGRRSPREKPTLENSVEHLVRTAENYRLQEPQPTFAAQFDDLLALDRGVQSLMTSLNKEI